MRCRTLCLAGRFVLTLVMAHLPGCALAQTPIAQSEDTSLLAVSDNMKVSVLIRAATRNSESSCVFQGGRRSNKKLTTILHKLKISANEKALFVPLSVYADLIDPRQADIKIDGSEGILSIYGGDGSDSYFIRVYFDATKIYRRLYYSALIPNEPTQDTSYLLRVLKDEY